MDINYLHLAIWIFIFLVLVIIEVLTLNVATVWFCIGSVFAFFSAFFTKDLNLQIVIFIIFSVLSIFFTKNFLQKIMNFKKINTNSDSLIGRTCLVTEEINNFLNQGQVTVGENIWSALSEDDGLIKKGTKVKIKSIRGVKLVVEEIKN